MEKIVVRMGDSSRIEMSAAEIQQYLEINCVNMFKDRVGIRSYKSFN